MAWLSVQRPSQDHCGSGVTRVATAASEAIISERAREKSPLAWTSQRVASRAGARACEDKARADLSAEAYSCSTSSTRIKRNAVLARHRARVVATR